jgi:hypothetical protein
MAIPHGPVIMNSVLVDVNQDDGKATNIQRVDRMVD